VLFRSIARGLVDLLAPLRCPGCDYPLASERDDRTAFCDACGVLLEPVASAFSPPSPSSSAYVFGGPLADAVRRLKYDRRTDLVEPLASLLADAGAPFAGLVDVIVPVPLHARRLRERGFNQASLLARPLASRLGVAFSPRLVVRARDTAPQVGLDGARRASNVRGAFRVACAAAVDGRRVLVVDDVRTTGSTLAAVAEEVRRAGARTVLSLTLCRAEPASGP